MSFPENYVNSFSNHKFFGWTKLKAFADDKLKASKIIISLLDGVENIFGKCFQKACIFFRVGKSRDSVGKAKKGYQISQ